MIDATVGRDPHAVREISLEKMEKMGRSVGIETTINIYCRSSKSCRNSKKSLLG